MLIMHCIFASHTFLSVCWDLVPFRDLSRHARHLTIWLLESLALTAATFLDALASLDSKL